MRGITDVLFPVFCICCKKEGTLLCEPCREKIPVLGVFLCPRCGEDTPQGITCLGCASKVLVHQHVALAPYEKGSVIESLIENCKYTYSPDVNESFDILIQKFFNEFPHVLSKIECIVPVPLHKKRYAERGFNQSEILARILGKILQVPVEHAIKRTRYTHQQATLSKQERVSNVADAFECVHAEALTGKHIVLVDDVYTTGSTLQSCAEAAKQALPASISGFSFARALPPKKG